MDHGKVKQAIFEATRFITKATELLQADDTFGATNPKESGACRRASLDLTRSLAEMRRAR